MERSQIVIQIRHKRATSPKRPIQTMADFCGLQRIAHVAKIKQILAGNIEETLTKPLITLWYQTNRWPTTWLFEDTDRELRLSGAVYCICVSDPNKSEACIRHGKSRSPGAAAEQEEAVRQRRISEEKGRYERGFPVGGHNERDEGRER